MTNLAFLYYYIGPIVLLLYPAMVLRSKLSRLTMVDVLLILISLILLTVKVYFVGPVQAGMLYRFFFGFLVFYIYFRNNDALEVDAIVKWLAIVTLIEAFLINTIVPVEIMPNYPPVEEVQTFQTNYFGFYQRPYGFGGSPSVTSSLLVALLALCSNQNNYRFVAFVSTAVVSCISGSGFVAFLIYACYRFFIAWKGRIPLFVIALIAFFFYFFIQVVPFFEELFYRISLEYLLHLWGLKTESLMTYFNEAPVVAFLFGTNEAGQYGGDFGFFSFLEVWGILGSILLLTFAFKNLNKKNMLAIVIMLVTTLHYSTIFFLPGQLIWAYALTRKQDELHNIIQEGV